ncbi:hypothetical protein [Prauserella flavalba]|uniref:hypothetical protein n=1 Tax=Prauserella flavalba TaxID=1477506 RepID=UPI0036ED4AED
MARSKDQNQGKPAGGGPQKMVCPTCHGNRIVPAKRAGAKPGDTEPCGTCDMDGFIWGPPA